MKKLFALAIAALALSFSGPAWAQQSIPGAKQGPSGSPASVNGVSPIVAPAAGAFGVGRPVAEDNGLPVVCLSGCAGTGGGTATKATAADPTLIEGSTTNQISVDLSGYMRAKVKGSVSLTGSLPDTAAGDLAAARASLGGTLTTQYADTAPAGGTITAADVGSTTIAGQGGVTLINGTPTANSFQTWAVNGKSSLNLTTIGTFVATMALEGSSDGGVTYVPISGLLRGTSTTTANVTAPGIVSAEVAGFDHVRARATSYTSGTPTLTPRFSSAPGPVKLTNPLVAGANSVGTVGIDAKATGGATPYHLITAASTNSTLIASGAHTLYSLQLTGLNATAGWLRAYDTAGAPTCSSATGAVHSWPVIGSATQQGGLTISLPAQGEAYLLGLAFCFTGGSADTDNTAGPAGVSINGTYK